MASKGENLDKMQKMFDEMEHKPKNINLQGGVVTDPDKFWKAHMGTVRNNTKKVSECPYYWRLVKWMELAIKINNQ